MASCFQRLRGLKLDRGLASFSAVFLLLSVSFGVAACSPGSVLGPASDAGITHQRDYRRVNLACTGLNLAHSELTVPEFRKIVHCFNSSGGLEPIEKLANRLSDADLRPIVDVGNRYIITNTKLLYQLEQTYNTLSERKIVDSTFEQFGRLLQNEEFVSSGIALLKEGYTAERGESGIAGDRSLLLALQQLSTRITYDNTASALDVGLTLARARSLVSLQRHFKGDSPAGRPLRQLTDQALRFIQESGDADHVRAGARLVEELANGDLFQATDQVMGTDPRLFPRTVPRLSSVIDAMAGDNAQAMDGVTSLFHYVHHPISCLKGSQTVPDAALHMIDELVKQDSRDASSYIKRTTPLILSALAPFCDFPPQLGKHFPAMVQLAGLSAIEPLTDLLKAVYAIQDTGPSGAGAVKHPLAELLIDILSDTGKGPQEDAAGVKLLLPALAELTDRGVWNDALLVSALPRLEDRDGLREDLHFLMQEMPGAHESIYTALSEAVSRAKPQSLYNFVHSLAYFVNLDQKLLDPSLTALRHAYYVNDVHPLIDLVQHILADAPSNDRLFNTMFMISEMPEFKDSVRLVSDMGKDGRLKELLGAVLTIFHKFATQGATPVQAVQEPAWVARSRHDWDESDLVMLRLTEAPSKANSACDKIDTRVSLGDYLGADFNSQLGDFVSCANSDRQHGALVGAVDFLRGHRDERGKNYVESTIDLVSASGFKYEELKSLGDSLLRSFDDHRLARVLDGAQLLIQTEVHGVSDAVGQLGTVLRPMLDLLRPITLPEMRASLHRLELFGASVLRRGDFPVLLKYVDDLLDSKKEPAPRVSNPYEWDRIKRWVGNKECEKFPRNASAADIETYKTQAAKRIVEDYDNSITSWDLDSEGRARHDWDLDEFKGQLNEVLTKFGDDAQAIRPDGAIDALINTLRYFTLPKGQKPNVYQHYPISEIRKFLIDRSNDYQLIPYYYPGELQPRVRLVNSIERMELVLINADFWAPWPLLPLHPLNKRNNGLLFMQEMADAWGDEDPSIWPEEIKKKFAGSRPPTLAQAVASMNKTKKMFEGLVGTPKSPYCKHDIDTSDPDDVQDRESPEGRHHGLAPPGLPGMDLPTLRKYLFNIEHVLPVLAENLPAQDQPLGQGGTMVNGMRILRDLLFQIAYSSPQGTLGADFRYPAVAWRNNLSLILRLERIGFTHQIARNLRGLDPNDPSVVDFFDTFVGGATASDDDIATTAHPKYLSHALLDPLLDPKYEKDPSKPEHALFWNVVRQIFAVVDAAEGRPLDAVHQAELVGKSAEEQTQIRQGWVREYMHMRQAGFYLFSVVSPLKLIRPALKTLGPLLAQYNSFLSENADKVETLFRSEKVSRLLRGMDEEVSPENLPARAALSQVLTALLNDPQNGLDGMGLLRSINNDAAAKQGFDRVSDRWDALKNQASYQRLNLDPIGRQALEFLEQRGSDANARAAARRLEDYAAELLEKQDLDQYFILAGSDPNGFYQVFQALGHSLANGELMLFFQEARDALSSSAASASH